MSHRVETMFSANGVTPWHKLGKVIEGTATTAEALVLAGLDWRVRKEPLRIATEWHNGQTIPAFATVRETDARVLGVVGPEYEVFQNVEAFEIGDELKRASGGAAQWETAGSLDDGSRVWMLLRTRADDVEEIAPGDAVRPYLLVATSHDGSAALRVFPTCVRVVCSNTLAMADSSRGRGEGFSFKHTRNMRARVDFATRTLQRAEATRAQWMDTARKMAQFRVTRDQARNFLLSVLELDAAEVAKGGRQGAKFQEARTRYHSERNAGGFGETLWSVLNTATEMTNHSERAGRSTGVERLLSVVDGTAARTNARAWDTAVRTLSGELTLA